VHVFNIKLGLEIEGGRKKLQKAYFENAAPVAVVSHPIRSTNFIKEKL